MVLLVNFKRLAILDSLFLSGERGQRSSRWPRRTWTEKGKIGGPIDTSPEDTGYYQ